MDVQVSAAKVAKYATHESGDTLEIIERPHGGLSVVLVDGQRSGRAAKIISNIVARKAISLLGEGVRDGAVARATHDYLRTHRAGQVSADMQIVSVDLSTHTLVISRNSRCPGYIVQQGELVVLDEASQAIGIYAHTKPVITELPLEPDTYVMLCTDGLTMATQSAALDLAAAVQDAARDRVSPRTLANGLLESALEAEHRRPKDDISVLVLAVLPETEADDIRRLSVSFPVRA